MTGKLARDAGDQAEHRPGERHSCEVQTTCQPPSAWCKDPWPATIRDISTGGLCLNLSRRFEPGSGLAIELPTEDGSTTTVLARVANAHADSEGGWLLGCTFISELSDEEVRVVLNLDPVKQASLASVDNLEGMGRHGKGGSINGVLFQARFGRGDILRWYVKRLDMSSNWPMPDGKVVCFRVGSLPPDTPPVEMTIKKCRRIGSYWIVDCKFLGTLSDPVLHALTTPSEQSVFA
jgi:hypothetical protein